MQSTNPPGERRRRHIYFLAIMVLGLSLGGLAYYRVEEGHIRSEKYQEIAAIANLKSKQILNWRQERLADAEEVVRSHIMTGAIVDWLRFPHDSNLRTAMQEQLDLDKAIGTYTDAFVVDTAGRTLVSTSTSLVVLDTSEEEELKNSLQGHHAELSSLFRCPDGEICLDAIAGVRDKRGQSVAAVVLRSNANDFLYPLIQTWPTPSRTAETVLIRREKDKVLFLNDLRFRPGSAFSLEIPLSKADIPAVQVVSGITGMFEGRDYRGKKVLADLRPIPGTRWFMVTKVDTDEILAEVYYRAGAIAVFVALSIMLTVASTAYSFRGRQANLYRGLYEAERKEREERELFKATLYSIGDAVITTDAAGFVNQMNPVAERLSGWQEADAKGKPLAEVFRIFDECSGAAAENPALRVRREGMVVGLANHTILFAKDGAKYPIADSGAPIRDEGGRITGIVLVFRDQTADRAAENSLRESEALLKEAQRLTLIGHYDLDIVSGMWKSSEMLDTIFGTGPDHEKNFAGWISLVSPEQQHELEEYFTGHVLRDKYPFDKEYKIVRLNDHAERWVHGLGKLEFDSEGNPIRMFGTIQDITERKSLEEQLLQSQKLESIGRLAGGVAHDYNNMLGVIIGYADLLSKKLPHDSSEHNAVDAILRASKRGADLTKQLLAFARKRIISPKVIHINQSIESIQKMLRTMIGENIDLTFRPGRDLWDVCIDPTQLDQVLINLATNARDAIEEFGGINITTSNVVADVSTGQDRAAMSPGEYVKIAFTDTGKGMDKETLAQAFEPFFTTKPRGQGTGLGLSTVYGIVKQNKGDIQVSSGPSRRN